MKLSELDQWYKENEVALDSLRAVNWGNLPHEQKFKIYTAIKEDESREAALQKSSAERFHAHHSNNYGKSAIELYNEAAQRVAK